MEDEIQNHSKKAYKAWQDPALSLWEKIKTIVIEIVIIVFAVSVSIGLQNISTKSQQNSDTKEFLIGLKKDLNQDIVEMEADHAAYVRKKAAFYYLSTVKIKENIQIDSMKKYSDEIFSTAMLMPNNGRFEGFKSSGKMGNIDNKLLQNDIMDLYQEDINILLMVVNGYVKSQTDLIDFITKNQKRTTDTSSNFLTLMKTDIAGNYFRILVNTEDVTERYGMCIDKMKKIITQIDEEYK